MYIVKGIYKSGDYFYLGKSLKHNGFTLLNPATEAFVHKGGFEHVKIFFFKYLAKKEAKKLIRDLQAHQHETPIAVMLEEVAAKPQPTLFRINFFNLFFIRIHV